MRVACLGRCGAEAAGLAWLSLAASPSATVPTARVLSCTAMLTLLHSVRSRVSCTHTVASVLVPVSSFSTEAAAGAAAAAATAAAPLTISTTVSSRYPDGKSPTQRVLEVLKSGPKTRKQIYYALNKGRPLQADLDVAAAAQEAALAKMGKKHKIYVEGPHAYPTGILRNPTHLGRLLQSLLRGKRLWARPPSSVEKLMGEAEHASIEEISANNAHAPVSAVLTTKGQVKFGGPSWVYVLRDWADKGFAAKGPQKQAQRAAKLQRQQEKKDALIAAAEEAGTPFQFGKVPRVSRRVRFKREKAIIAEKYEQRINEVTVAYRESVLAPRDPTQAEIASDDAHADLLRALNPKITDAQLSNAIQRRRFDDEEFARHLRRVNPKLNDAAVKLNLKKRAKFVAWVQTRSNMDEAEFATALRQDHRQITDDQIAELTRARADALQRAEASKQQQ